MKRIKQLLIIFIVLFGVAGIFSLLLNDLLSFYSDLTLQLPQAKERIVDLLLEKAEEEILTPPPLRLPNENPESFLTESGIIKWTNAQRSEQGLLPFLESEKLKTSACIKAKDMFEKQYFSHDSPSGVSVGDLAKTTGYEFIIVGENLALGDFLNDEDLVQGWMDSIGHRENILNIRYQEIGVCVIKDIFEGRMTWIAVQHFGLPLSACLQPDKALKQEIEAKQSEIEALYSTLSALEAEIKATRVKRGKDYNEKVKEYNTLVSQYNALIKETENLINKYNNQIEIFNECIAGI